MTDKNAEKLKEQKENDENLAALSKALQADIILYSGDIDKDGAAEIFEITEKPSNPNVLLMLCTPGGLAGDAYKIAKRLQHRYKKFYLYVYGWCKSAGTLVAIGSDEIIMGDRAEFGPLDVQVTDGEEIFTLNSGSNVFESLQHLESQYDSYFTKSLIWLAKHGGLSTKNAASIAANLASGFFNPILSNIDPLKIGELRRAMAIGIDYGKELTKNNRGNIKQAALTKLATQYNDHGYVIDFEQATDIFEKVRPETELERALGVGFKGLMRSPYSKKGSDGKEQMVMLLYGKEKADDAQAEQNAGSDRKSSTGTPEDGRGNISKFKPQDATQ
jgi:Serine dehydrogenase proteinase